MSRKVIVVLAVLVLLLIVGATLYVASIKPGHRTLIVPDNYATIGWALGNATDGDTVYVRSGTYNERGFVIDKPLSLIGEDASNTILIGGVEGIRGGGSTIAIRADNVTVSGFTIRSYDFQTPAWYFFGIYMGGNNSKVTNNIIENCDSGIWNDGTVANASSVIISENTIRDNLHNGILIGGSSSHISIIDNNVSSNLFGISISDGFSCVISGNNVSANRIGAVGISGSKNDIIGNSLISNHDSSVTFYGSSDLCRIWNNTIENCQVGVDLSAGSRYSVGGNNISNCTAYAIGFYQTSTSYIFENNITDNTIGISFSQREDATPMNYSSFYRNNLINNGQHIFIGVSGSINNWDSNGLGNYWSDYTTKYPDAAEMNNTGIWNTPYVIDANNEDRNPLVNPYNT